MKNLREHGFPTDNKVYIVAEIGINHGGDVKTAKKLIDSAAETGVDSVKFQTYLTEKRVPAGSPIFDILKKCELPFSVFEELKTHAESRGMVFFSTPFDAESIDFLESINCSMYKVASFDVVNRQLLSRLSGTGKPIIMSVGMSTEDEIRAALEILKDNASLLHCISAYPLKEEDANLSAIYSLREKFDCIVGYSDHTNDIYVPLYAVAAGAQIIEKHYMVDERMNCADAAVSISETQMKKLVEETRKIERIFGSGELSVRVPEKGCEIFRRHTSI